MAETVETTRFVYEFGDIVVDPQDKTVFVDGRPVHLPAKEFETLIVLIEHNGRALTKDEMMSAIWHDTHVEEGNLATYVSRLRKVFNTNGQRFIETLPKHGYRFTADLHRAVLPIDEPVLIEKRTVRRLTIGVENGAERRSLPGEGRSRYKLPALAALVLTVIGLAFFSWRYRADLFPVRAGRVDTYAPVRLTDNPNDDTGPVWGQDGRIRFSRVYSDNRSEAWVMNADGTDQTAVKQPEGKRIVTWSPDDRKIVFYRLGDASKMYLSNADGSGETPLPFRSGAWSADSKMLTYHQRVLKDNFDIFVYDIETGESRNLTNSESFEADPSFSPDGSQVVFASNRDGNAEIYVINVDGSKLRRVTTNPSIDSHPAFSPDGTQILFTSDRENENADVYIVRSDGTGAPVKLTNWDKSNESAGPGSWSPDGTKIAFFSDREGKDDIYVVSAESSRPTALLSDPGHDLDRPSYSPDGKSVLYCLKSDDKTGEIRVLDIATGNSRLVKKTEMAMTTPAWSPDGQRITFYDRLNGNSEVFVIGADGTGLEDLTNDPATDTFPAWSPDGQRVVFLSGRGEQPDIMQLFMMNADGSDPRPVTHQKGWEGDPAWSPDGKIIFACDRTDTSGNVLDICEINPDGTGERRVLFHRGHDSLPAVSPDGDRIAFTASSDGNSEIYVMNRDGSALLRVTRDPADDQSPKWSPDGRKLIFISNRAGKFGIYEIEIP